MLRFNLIVAVCENFGIGLKGKIPWHLKSELKYFGNTTKRTSDPAKRNAVIMGKNTYFSIPPSHSPLPDRLNIVLSTTMSPEDLPKDVLLSRSLEGAMETMECEAWTDQVENVWIVGGSRVYADGMKSQRFHRLYMTKIQEKFECDTFFPTIPDDFREVPLDEFTPHGVQEENGIKYEYKIFEKQ